MCRSSIEAEIILRELEKKPIEHLTFPSHFDVAIQLKKEMSGHRFSTDALVSIVSKDPVVAMKTIQAAKQKDHKVTPASIREAVECLGPEQTKKVVLTTITKQLDQVKGLLRFASITRLIWLNSIYLASAAYEIAEAHTDLDPNEAFLNGLVLNTGAFYLIYQASLIQTLRENIDDVLSSIDRFYLGRTKELMSYFEMSEKSIHSVSIQLLKGTVMKEPPQTMLEVLYAANQIACSKFPWINQEEDIIVEQEMYVELLPAIEERFQLLKTSNY